MSTKINDDSMSLEIDGRVIATAQFREHGEADGHGAWIVSCHPGLCGVKSRPVAVTLGSVSSLALGHDGRPCR
jgi:hypothetical protein